MKNFSLFTFIIILSAAISCKSEPDRTTLQGLWKLHIMEQKDSLGNWNEWRDGMQGLLLYDNDQSMALHLTTKGYEDTELRFPNFNDTISLEALKHLTGSYVYIGKYEIQENGTVVQHTRLSHSNPGDWGKVVKRKFHFKEDSLIMVPAEQENASLRLKWVKH